MTALKTPCIALTLILLLLFCSPVSAQPNPVDSFLPTWKLLKAEQKQQFIAGYIEAWKDAARVTDIVISFVESNPQKAIDGLKSIRTLYDLSAVRPEAVVREIDDFYKEPENKNAPLTQAVSAARMRLE